jgi:methyl-accepting chemotaxis protein
MRQLSLSRKISILAGIPLFCFVTLAGKSFLQEIDSSRESSKTARQVEYVRIVSSFIHDVQKERGMTAGYLSGGLAETELRTQRAKTDAQAAATKASQAKSMLPPELQAQITQAFAALESLRPRVDQKAIKPEEAIAGYSAIVGELLALYTGVSERTTIAKASAEMRSTAILEYARESGGKLRANLTSILSKDEPIPAEVFSKLIRLKSDVDSNLGSKGLLLTESQKKLIAEFQASEDWSRVGQIFQLVLKKSDEGRFGQDPKALFELASRALDRMGTMIDAGFVAVSETLTMAHRESLNQAWILGLFLLTTTLLLCGLVFWLARDLATSFRRVAERLGHEAEEVREASGQIRASSTDLSESATQQAAAIQETAASMNQIQAMVEKNQEASQRLRETATESSQATRTGKDTVDRMIRSITEISDNNRAVMSEIERGNGEISKIVKLIAEIGDKTKVINDIVFQTKLLSFNASVEAARAGEHGKGFAVVAEEVGNLAQMSGNAAKEIADMLGGSIDKVEAIVRDTQARIEQLAGVGTGKLTQGAATAEECGRALEEILQNVGTVESLVAEIVLASKEQSSGISEISKAMNQLDAVTARTTSAAQQSADSSEALDSQSIELRAVVAELRSIVNGASRATYPRQSEQPARSDCDPQAAPRHAA